MKLFYELFIVSVVFILVGFIYRDQPRITVNEGRGWDGSTYYLLAEQYYHDSAVVTGEAPFAKRIGTPFLIAAYSKITGTGFLESALILDLAGAFVILLLLVCWLRRFITDTRIRFLLYFLYLMAWHGPLRLSFFYPMFSDIWSLVLFLTGLLLLDSARNKKIQTGKISFPLIAIFSVIVFAAILFRESNIILAVAAPFILNPFNNFKTGGNFFAINNFTGFIAKTFRLYTRKESLILFLPFVFAIAAYVLVGKFTIMTYETGYSYFKSLFSWFYTKSLPQYLIALFTCFGPLLLLLPFYYRNYKNIFSEKQDLLVLILLILLLGYIGGSDTERIIYMSSFPIVFILIGIAAGQLLNSPQRWWLIVLLAVQTVAYRFYWYTPDYLASSDDRIYPVFTLPGSHFEYLMLYAEFGSDAYNTIILVEYALLFLLTAFVINNSNKFKLPS